MKQIITGIKLFAIIFILFFIFIFINEKIVVSINDHTLPCILINEVMYNPIYDDNYYEWVELYNPTNQSINISGWTITDNYSEDLLEGDRDHGNGTTIIPPNGYALITDHGTMFYENCTTPDNTVRLYVHDNSIGNGLSNTKDKLILKNQQRIIIDAIEWGEDYPDIPGTPFHLIDENHSLSRYHLQHTNDTSIDFYDELNPTPGSQNNNIPFVEPEIACELYPQYIAKIPRNKQYSSPFLIKITLKNITLLSQLQLKAYVVGNVSHNYPATQIYMNHLWQYAYYYQNITVDNKDKYTLYVPLRFKKDYQEYQQYIRDSTRAYLVIKIKIDLKTYEHLTTVTLMDMDNTTTNGTAGGYIVGIAKKNDTILENTLICVKNSLGQCTGFYRTEHNDIDDNAIIYNGYYKIPTPIGTNYSLQFIDDNNSIIYEITNITVEPGEYDVRLSSSTTFYQVLRGKNITIPINITNTGKFPDNYLIKINDIPPEWSVLMHTSLVYLHQNATYEAKLTVFPSLKKEYSLGIITLHATSSTDPIITTSLQITIEVLAPDLVIPKIKCLNENNKENYTYNHGETITIKAFTKNQGNYNATNVTVTFYYDQQDRNHFLGKRSYDSIGKYQKYPSLDWDTQNVSPGLHTLLVVVDEENKIEEFNETNNNNSVQILLHKTLPGPGKDILITEIYYHTHPCIKNEFITIYNPTEKLIDISGWYITNNPQKPYQKQTKIFFPNRTILFSQSKLLITQNATDYLFETGLQPDFEYLHDSIFNIPNMIAPKAFSISNIGEALALKDPWNHTIDLIIYGKSNLTLVGWSGPPINASGAGVILKRNFKNNRPCDTNTSIDWIHPRRYGIGQSDFPLVSYNVSASVTTFVSPDCSYFAVCNELRNATKSIVLNMYEFTNPSLGDELLAALQRNISVRIFMEGSPVGGIDNQQKIILQKLHDLGAEIRFIVSDPKNNVYARYPYNHAKYCIIDDQSVIVQSCNYVKTGVPCNPSFGNREWGIIMRNTTIANSFNSVFNDDWNPQRCDSYTFEAMNFSISLDDTDLDTSIPTGRYTPRFSPKTYITHCTITPIFSPDTSEQAIYHLIDSAQQTIYIEQLYIYKDWEATINPFVQKLIQKAQEGVDVKILLNFNPKYDSGNSQQMKVKSYIEQFGIQVRFFYTNWSIFTNIHNKGVIVDNTSVLISSINWNENSVRKNREAGVIVENQDIATYYAEVLFYDWNYNQKKNHQEIQQQSKNFERNTSFDIFGILLDRSNQNPQETTGEYKNILAIVCIFIITVVIIMNDWRKRSWK
ncbi:MAG: phospholipase D-like domain-containing protein [Candidatus Thermoplasmatota archaeon]